MTHKGYCEGFVMPVLLRQTDSLTGDTQRQRMTQNVMDGRRVTAVIRRPAVTLQL